MKKIPMLEKFAAQSLVEHDGELIFSKERFAELIVRECAEVITETRWHLPPTQQQIAIGIKEHFGVEE